MNESLDLRIYSEFDSAFEQRRGDDVLRLALPDAMVRHGAEESVFNHYRDQEGVAERGRHQTAHNDRIP